jgi:hypothetical protein
MAPPTTFVALVIVLALVPGWFYLRLIERIERPRTSSTLHELLEVLAVGVATTGVSTLLFLLLPHSWLPFAVDVSKWGIKGNQYLKQHVRQSAAAAAIIFAASMMIAYALARVRARRRTAEFDRHDDVWNKALGRRPAGTHPFVGLKLKDGRLIEGSLKAFPLDSGEGPRDIALERPIRITPADGGGRHTPPNVDRLIIDSSQLDYLMVGLVPAVSSEARPGRLRAMWRRILRRR